MAIIFLLSHREEDLYVDYKVSFGHEDERAWLELTKDVLAFANTRGGYLVFGVKDASFEVVGLASDLVAILTNVNNLRQKLNRYIEPDITLIRSKPFLSDGKSIVVLFVPESHGLTHVVSRDGTFRYPPSRKYSDGQLKTLLRQGTSYVRRSAGNHLLDSRDLDAIFNRRLDQFREALVSKMTRVVEAPLDSQVVVLSKDQANEEQTRFVIQDAPDAIPIKGLGFTVSPNPDST